MNPSSTPSNNLPWILGGSATIVALGGGALGLYRMGRQSGQAAAQVSRVVSEYKTLVDLAPSAPSRLEEELYGLKSAQPDRDAREEFAAQLDEFDAAQLDAAFADVEGEALPAAQQVFPIGQSNHPRL
ncbi:MAG: hypothetical protein HC805_05390 [Alkalinema sp. RL_2_19]|nr:hypothetical protein [Alkalinema sp. RL_2_19]